MVIAFTLREKHTTHCGPVDLCKCQNTKEQHGDIETAQREGSSKAQQLLGKTLLSKITG